MNHSLKQKLSQECGASIEVITALERSIANAASVSYEANIYARAMEKSFDEFGVDGLKTQILYMLMNLRNWRGEEARESKKILQKFVK